ncbi:sulfotransferase family protein [Thiogranum longum]|uniref:Sulfotransferase family protein n=2 Tax=Thiogranum longum TaxID=1537524 RepID=A0A4V2PH58_9GAMM|nr:sulfotransferase family protein [Thiogranum longum]
MGRTSSRWIIVLSAARSGSTLLSVILGAHSRIIAPPELHLLRYKTFEEWRNSYPMALRSLCVLMEKLGEKSDTGSIESRFCGMQTVDIYREIVGHENRGKLLVDKSPSYGRMGDDIKRLEEIKPFYIWLIRHPLGVMASRTDRQKVQMKQRRNELSLLKYYFLALKYKVQTLLGITTRTQLEYWKEVHTCFEKHLSGVSDDRKHVVHFEDLVRNPEVVVKDLCNKLQIDIQPSMLDPVKSVTDDFEWGLGDEKIHKHKKIDSGVADDWKDRCDASVLNGEIRKLMERIGVIC